MKLVFEAAQEIQQFINDKGWTFCFIGGVALQRWGIPRITNDVDLTLLTGFGTEDEFIDPILSTFVPRLSEAKEFALKTRVLLVRIGNVGIDISLGAIAFEESSIARSSVWEVTQQIALRTCSAEDLIVHKAFAGRLQDWADIDNVLLVQQDLDWDYIEEQLLPLLELSYRPETMDELRELRKRRKSS